jgi:hypothetical protein
MSARTSTRRGDRAPRRRAASSHRAKLAQEWVPMLGVCDTDSDVHRAHAGRAGDEAQGSSAKRPPRRRRAGVWQPVRTSRIPRCRWSFPGSRYPNSASPELFFPFSAAWARLLAGCACGTTAGNDHRTHAGRSLTQRGPVVAPCQRCSLSYPVTRARAACLSNRPVTGIAVPVWPHTVATRPLNCPGGGARARPRWPGRITPLPGRTRLRTSRT